jgi:hypothetical protein
MNDWEKILILGTDHLPVTPEIRAFWATAGIDPALNGTAFMRISLAMHVGFKKIAPTLSKPASEKTSPSYLENSADITVNTRTKNEKTLSFQELTYLKKIFKNTSFLDLQITLFNRVKEGNRFVPVLLLPTLFDIACQDAFYYKRLQPVIPENGYHLLPKNKKWRSLLPSNDENVWYVGTFSERIALLTHLCVHLPNRIETILSSTWKEESSYDKIHFFLLLEKMDILPGDYLTDLARKDNDFELIKISTRIRCKLRPDDKEIEQLKVDVLACFKFNENTLWVQMPEPWPEHWRSLGFNEDRKKSTAYLPFVSIFHPSVWHENLQVGLEQFLDILLKEAIYKLWLPHLTQAVLHYKSNEWAFYLLQYAIEYAETCVLSEEVITAFIDILSGEESIKLTQKYLLHWKEPIDADHILYNIIIHPYLNWSERNTQHLQFHLVKMWEKYLVRGFFAFEHYEELFLLYARRCNLTETINEDGWLEALDIPSNQPSLFFAFNEIIDIRKKVSQLL